MKTANKTAKVGKLVSDLESQLSGKVVTKPAPKALDPMGSAAIEVGPGAVEYTAQADLSGSLKIEEYVDHSGAEVRQFAAIRGPIILPVADRPGWSIGIFSGPNRKTLKVVLLPPKPE